MFTFLKKLCGHCDSLEERQKKANAQDRKVREQLTETQIDKGLKDTMEGSDPVAKY